MRVPVPFPDRPMAMRLVAWLALTLLATPALAQQAHWQLLDPGDLTHPTARTAHMVVVDAPGRRLVAWGDAIPVGEIWTMALDGPAVWTRVPTQGTPPPARTLGSAIFDPVRRRMVIFGGGAGETTRAFLNDVWALQLDGVPTWTRILPGGTLPDPRQMHAAIYDAPRDRMLVFGGISSQDPSPNVTRENSVWALSLGDSPEWTRLVPTGTPPSPRQSASMVFDAAGNRAVVFGGSNPPSDPSYLSDVWALSLGGTLAWYRLTPAGTPPSARYEHVAVMDEARRRMLVFAGRGLNLISTSDTYALSLGPEAPAWTNLGATNVTARYGHAGVIDPVTDRLIVDGGAYGGTRLVETLALPLGGTPTWQTLSPVGIPPSPPARYRAAPLVDPVTDQLLIQGGQETYLSTGNDPNDLWSWPLGSESPAWTRLREHLPGNSSAVILDPLRRRQMRFFAGSTGVQAMPLDVPGDWTAVTVAGTAPPTRTEYSLAYDPLRDRILLSGGYMDDPRGHSRHIYTDIWALSLADPPAWQVIRADDGLGLAPFADALFYDARGDRLLGVGSVSGIGNGGWGRPGDGSSDWTTLGILVPLTSGSAVYDPGSEELIVLQLDRGTAWHLPVNASAEWQPLAISGNPPPLRKNSRVAFDGARRRVLVFGGTISSIVALGDLWALQLDLPVPVAVSLASSDARPDGVRLLWWSSFSAGTVATLESRRGEESWHAIAELVTDGGGRFGYEDRNVSPGERVGYRLVSRGTPWPASEVWVTVPQRATLALAGARPNPAVDAPVMVFSLASDSPARLELFDLAGRRLATREVGTLGAGEHHLRIGESLAPGLYVARLAQQGKVVTARFAVAR